eukprot:Platyproteum_vivax@DN2722_c0_g1_i1.p2
MAVKSTGQLEGYEASIGSEVARGSCLVQFILDPSELSSFQTPTPCFKVVRRLAYLPAVLGDVMEYLQLFSPPTFGAKVPSIWMDIMGIPIDWRLPVGVLLDVHGGTPLQSPVPITVHFTGSPNFPKGVFLRPEPPPRALNLPSYSPTTELTSNFTAAFKQGLFLRSGDNMVWASLQKK